MIRITKKEIAPEEEVKKPLCGHIIYDEPEYSMQNPLVRLIMALLLLFVLSFTSIFVRYELFLYFFAYFLLGAEVLAKGIVALAKRCIDENLLMLILMLSAIAIGRREEALLLLLFYGFGNLWQNAESTFSREKLNALFIAKDIENKENFEEIAEKIKQASMQKPENRSFIARAAFYYTPILLTGVVLAFLVLLFTGSKLDEAFFIAALFLLLCVPFSLLFAIPASFGLAVHAARKHNIFVKNSNFIEEMQYVDALVLDNPEDLTLDFINKMKLLGVKKCIILNSYHTMKEEEATALGIDLILTQDGIDTARQVAMLDKLMQEGQIRKVAFVGTKFENAPVAAGAEVAIAFYKDGAEFLAQASDIVYIESPIDDLSKIFMLAKKTRAINKENIIFALLVRISAIALVVMGMLDLWQAILIEIATAIVASANAMRLIALKK